jgi:hypothetical protein
MVAVMVVNRDEAVTNIDDDGAIHLTVHSEDDGRLLLSLWDDAETAKTQGSYVRVVLTEEQLRQIRKAADPHVSEDESDTCPSCGLEKPRVLT